MFCYPIRCQLRTSKKPPLIIAGRPWRAEIYLRFQVACDHVIILKFSYLSMLLQATNWLRFELRMAPEGQSPSRPPRSPRDSRGLAKHVHFSHDHVMIHKFYLPFYTITGNKLVVTSYADGSGGPITLRTSPLASELPLTCQALPFAGGPSGPYLSACGGQLLTVRCAHYAGGASLTTFGFVTIVPRYLLPQVMPSHSFAALTALVVRRISGYAD